MPRTRRSRRSRVPRNIRNNTVHFKLFDSDTNISLPAPAAGLATSAAATLSDVVKDFSQYQAYANLFYQYRVNAIEYRFIPSWSMGDSMDQVRASGVNDIIFAVAPIQTASGTTGISTGTNLSTFMALTGAREVFKIPHGRQFIWKQHHPRAIGASINDLAVGTFSFAGNRWDRPRQWYATASSINETDKQMFPIVNYYVRGSKVASGGNSFIRVEKYLYISFRHPFVVGAANEGEDVDL